MNYLRFSLKFPKLLFFGFICTIFCNFGQTLLISLYVPDFLKTFELQNAAFGTFYSAATLLSALSLFYFGKLIDHVSLRKYSLVVAIGFAFSALTVSVSESLFILFVGIFGLRLCGQSLLPHISTTSMARFFDPNRGKALSISNLGFSIGEGIFPLLVALLITAVGWRQSWQVIGISTAIILVPLFLWLLQNVPKQPIDSKYSNTKKKTKKEIKAKSWTRNQVLKDYRFYMILPAAVLPAFLMTGLFLYQLPLAASKGWSAKWIATCMISYGAIRAIGSLFVGPVIDRVGAVRLYPWSLVPFIAALLAMAFIDHKLVGMFYLGLCGLSVGIIGNAKSALLAEVYGTAHLGSIRSLILPIIIFSTAVAPILMGSLIDEGVSFNAVLIGSAVLTFICTIFSLVGAAGYYKSQDE